MFVLFAFLLFMCWFAMSRREIDTVATSEDFGYVTPTSSSEEDDEGDEGEGDDDEGDSDEGDNIEGNNDSDTGAEGDYDHERDYFIFGSERAKYE